MYNSEPLDCVECFKYLGLKVPSNHRWNECATRRLEARKITYYAFENTCNHGAIKCWVLKKYLFDTLMTNASLWGGSIGCNTPKSTWKEFENVQKYFLTKFLQVKKQMSYTLLLEMGLLPIEIMAMERVVEYMIRFKKVLHIDFLVNCI